MISFTRRNQGFFNLFLWLVFSHRWHLQLYFLWLCWTRHKQQPFLDGNKSTKYMFIHWPTIYVLSHALSLQLNYSTLCSYNVMPRVTNLIFHLKFFLMKIRNNLRFSIFFWMVLDCDTCNQNVPCGILIKFVQTQFR